MEEKPVEEKAPAAAPVAASAQGDNFSILGAQQEAINGRAVSGDSTMIGLLGSHLRLKQPNCADAVRV